jgi:hypothetical protein
MKSRVVPAIESAFKRTFPSRNIPLAQGLPGSAEMPVRADSGSRAAPESLQQLVDAVSPDDLEPLLQTDRVARPGMGILATVQGSLSRWDTWTLLPR